MPEKNDFQLICDADLEGVSANIPHLNWQALPLTDLVIAPNSNQLTSEGYQLLLMVIPPNAESKVKRRAFVRFDRQYALWKTAQWLQQKLRGASKDELRAFLIDLINEVSK